MQNKVTIAMCKLSKFTNQMYKKNNIIQLNKCQTIIFFFDDFENCAQNSIITIKFNEHTIHTNLYPTSINPLVLCLIFFYREKIANISFTNKHYQE